MDMKPADVILQQLGGRNRLNVMIGAKDFYSVNDGNTLSFKFAGCKKANCVKITLNARDLYDIEFIKIGRRNPTTFETPVTEVKTFEDIYADTMREVIENFTEMRLSLGTMGR